MAKRTIILDGEYTTVERGKTRSSILIWGMDLTERACIVGEHHGIDIDAIQPNVPLTVNGHTYEGV